MAKRTRSSNSGLDAAKQSDNAVQRANVRRAQQSGRQRAKAQAERTAASASNTSPSTPRKRSKTKTAPTTAATATASTHPTTNAPVSTATRRRFVWVLILMVAGLIGLAAARNGRNWWAALQVGNAQTLAEQATATAPPVAAALSQPEVTPTAASEGEAVHVGLISGHRGNDSGSVCNDGLTEASVNFATATRVAALLRAEGYTVDILDEFDPRLNGYNADVLLSIHSDSCTYINDQASGYKIARFLYSDIPSVEDKLVACVSMRYKKATGLRFHANTVTHNMTEYHALRKINPKTPGAIIELGFMYLDRAILTKRQDDMARGIASGLDCFLKGETP